MLRPYKVRNNKQCLGLTNYVRYSLTLQFEILNDNCRDYNKDHGISNGAGSANRKRKYNDGTEATLLPSPRQLNMGSGEVPLSSFQPSEQRLVVPIVETLQMRSTVRAAKVDDDGVSSSQETVFSFDETPEVRYISNVLALISA